MFFGADIKATHWCRYQGVSWKKIHTQLLGALAKLRKATNIIVVSVRLSSWKNLVGYPLEWILMKFGICVRFVFYVKT